MSLSARELLREACRVALRSFGYDDLWKEWAWRVLSKSLQPIVDRLVPPPEGGDTDTEP